MVTHIAATTIDCANPNRLAEFWCGVLGYRTVDTGESTDGSAFVEIGPADGDGPAVLFEQVADLPPKREKNRVHLDVAAPTGSYRAEVSRILDLGAEHKDVGQRGVPWTVLTDPEGNEFCVLNRDKSADVRG
jgi:catechol 2,3-dioxygenase-like lactoylglutathione lyase family enzyme